MASLKEFVLANVKPDDYYSARFSGWNPRVRGNVRCPFHDDHGPSLSVALRNGGAKCHGAGCSCSLGNIIHFESCLKKQSEKMAARKLYSEFIRPIVSKTVVQAYRDALATNGLYLFKIKKEMGLNATSIRRFCLGLDLKTNRITIPIYDQFDQCVNIRFYRLPSERKSTNEEKIYNLKGYGRLDLFPYPQIAHSNEPIYFMAGEKDCMLAIQNGLNAFTTTNGEGSWNRDWNLLFKNHQINLVFDRDNGGRSAGEKMSAQFIEAGIDFATVAIPFKSNRSDRKDFTDYILKDQGSMDGFNRAKKLQSKAQSIFPSVSASNQHVHGNNGHASAGAVQKAYPLVPDFESDHLHELIAISSKSNLLNKRVKTMGIVAAKSPNTYSIPWKFKIELKNRPEFDYELPMGRDLLRFIKSSDTSILQVLQKIMGSTTVKVIPVEYLTATEVEVIPTAAADKDVPYVVQRCYYFGDRIEANVPYYLEVIPTSEIRTQETIGIITSYSPLSRSIERFTLTPEIQASLSVFWPEGGRVWEKLKSIANEITAHYTHVYNRLDWHLVALLSWCSPIGFRFPADTELQRGWINALALGDTETGKSKVAKALRTLFNCGVFVNAENCTYVGLVGGAIKMGSGQLMLRWGRIPLSDKQLVVLEELSGLSVDEISNMSDVRSSGIARLDKGGINSETNSRTRLLCLSNVRSERKNLSNYLYGVLAVRELIGHGEDIARFDLITTLTDREVSNEVINASSFATVAKTIHQDQLQTLCHFIWSLTPEQIQFEPSAYEACLNETKILAAEYHPSIPVFKGGSGRYKLGRIAAAIACLQFAWDNTHSVITVNSKHVAAAVKLLRLIYNKPSFGYRQYSQQMFDREKIKDEQELRDAFEEKIPESRLTKVLETLIHSTRFTRDELQAIAGVTQLYADQLIGTMVRERALRKGDANVWEIEPAGKSFMEKLMQQYEQPQRTTRSCKSSFSLSRRKV